VVGYPSKKLVWIMSREPSLDADIQAGIFERLADVGYDTSLITAVPQRPLAERD